MKQLSYDGAVFLVAAIWAVLGIVATVVLSFGPR